MLDIVIKQPRLSGDGIFSPSNTSSMMATSKSTNHNWEHFGEFSKKKKIGSDNNVV